jgi:hypothetical protein
MTLGVATETGEPQPWGPKGKELRRAHNGV